MLIFICLFFILLIVVIVFIVYTFRNPRCGGYLDPQTLFCDKSGRVVSRNDCVQGQNNNYINNILKFLDYMKNVNEIQRPDDLESVLKKFGKTYKGVFIFAIPELLKILPSDFGQNYISPYGFISFYDPFFSCIDSVSDFCGFVTKNQSLPIKDLCALYVAEKRTHNKECPFPIKENNPDVLIQDKGFFNAIGLLGAFSLTPSQIVLLYQEIPVSQMNLMYWSYNVYIVDSLNPDAICSPYRQINFASVASAFSMFHSVGLSGKRFNPLTADTNTVKKGYVCVYITISINPTVSERIEEFLKQNSPKPFDVIKSFVIATGKNSVRLDPSIPNPNQIPNHAAAFDPKTQRLACFLRLIPDWNQDQTQKDYLHNYIYGNENRMEVVLLDNDNVDVSRLDNYFLAPTIAPIYNEKELLYTFRLFKNKIIHQLSSQGFTASPVQSRNSMLNVVAPFYKNILNTKLPFLGGFQAIQLAGNAQGDNPDAHYRLSKAVCLTNDDVFLGVCVNHSHFKNCVFNSINIVDVNKAYGYDGVTINSSFPFPFYIVLTGRNIETLNLFRERLLQEFPGNYIKTIFLQTGDSDQGDVPVCNRILMVERIYLNNYYRSKKNPETSYNLIDVFGEQYTCIDESLDQDVYDSLQNLTRPDLDQLVIPYFYKMTRINWNVIFITTIIVLSVLLIVLGIWNI